MTGAGAPGAAGIIRCILQPGIFDLIVADAKENAVGRYLHNNFVHIPPASNVKFIDTVLEICIERNIQVVMPLVTKELLLFASHKQMFEDQGIKVLVSSKDAIEIANNKSRLYEFLQSKELTLPAFSVVSDKEAFIHAAFELDHPHNSFCFKPSVSNGSRGVRIVSDSINELDQLFNEKPYNLYITYAHALKILSSGHFPELLVSEFLPGDEYSVDCLANNGEAIIVVPRLRKKMINGISVEGIFENDKAIIDYCAHIIKLVNLHGNIGIQLRRNQKGRALLLEINPRVQGTIVAGLGAGINLPVLAIKQELGLKIEPSELDVKWGTQFSRYWMETFY